MEKATVVEGKVTATKGTDKVMIDGNWYTMNKSVTAPKLNASVKLVLVNGYAYKVDTVTAGSTDVALIVALGNSSTVGSKYYQARLILADGTDKVVDVEKKDGNDDPLAPNATEREFNAYKNMLATYDVSKDVYTLTVINGNTANENLAGYENFYYTTSATIDGSIRDASNNKKFSDNSNNTAKDVSRAYFYDTATVFVKYKNNDYKVVTGKAIKGWDKTTVSGNGTVVRMLTEKDNNSQYAGVAFVDLGAKSSIPGSSDKTYAVALDKSYTTKEGSTTYTIINAWNGSEETEYKYEGTFSTAIAKGDVFEYSSNGDGTYDITRLTTAVPTQVKTYDEGSGEISFSAPASGKDSIANLTVNNSKIDSKDSKVLYVDSAKAKGVAGGSIQLANKFNGNTNNNDNNVTVYVDDGDDCITLIVVDISNNMDW